MAGPGSPGFIGVDLNCNQGMYHNISFIAFFHCFLYEYNGCFCLSIAVGGCMIMVLYVGCQAHAEVHKFL